MPVTGHIQSYQILSTSVLIVRKRVKIILKIIIVTLLILI